MSERRDRERQISRRAFLKRNAAGAAFLAVPWIVRASALGADGAVPPSERITLGFIGLGGGDKRLHGCLGMGRCHFDGALPYVEGPRAGFLSKAYAQILAVCDVDRRFCEHARQTAEDYYAANRGRGTYRACTCYNDFRELLGREDIDAVVIATPPHWHAVMAAMACKAGKDVYCEKPLGLTIRESRAVVEAARRYGRVVQVGTQYACLASSLRACGLALSGRLGKVTRAELGDFSEPPMPRALDDFPADPVPEYLDWDLFVGPNPWLPFTAKCYPQTWRKRRAFGWQSDMSIHWSPVAQRGLGMDRAGPVEVVPGGVRYANGLEIRRLDGTLGVSMRLVGTEGWAGIAGVPPILKTDPPELAKASLGPNDVHLHAAKDHHEDFLDCIRTRRLCGADAESHHRVMSLHLIRGIAAVTGATGWDPDKEVFVGPNADAANRYLSRPYREPWRV